MHYQRWRKDGDPGEAEPRFMLGVPEVERFWAKVDRRGDDECWPWKAGTFGSGYGHFSYERFGGGSTAHRFAYELLVGPIPDGLELDHLCHTQAVVEGACGGGDECPHRRCVNPAHLEPVDRHTNVARGNHQTAVNMRKTECLRGHDLTDPANLKPTKSGARQCRECSNMHRRDRYRRLGR